MLLLATAVFVGSQACVPCHAAIARSYARTPMALSSGKAEPLAAVTFVAAGQRYSIRGKTLTFPGGTSTIDYFIGSNAAGRAWLRERDGYLYELPVTWYAQKKIWDASPGYEHDSWVRLNRAVEPSCLLCHASRVRPVLGTQNRYGNPPFEENGVSCERCHGPGSEHVRDPRQTRMVNPARLDAERRDSVCSQCHLTADARIERPNRRMAAFQAGERLSDYATYLLWNAGLASPGAVGLKVTSHVERLSASACKIASGDALWCGTCHDPHTNTDKTQAACLSCHASAHHPEQMCATCHMPKTKSADANHGVLTDHSIPRTAKPALQNAATPALAAFLGVADDRALGLAYAELGDPRARSYLSSAQPADWPVRLRLAVVEPVAARAAALYESVLKDQPGETAALVNLGILYAAAGRTKEAIAVWERALAANPAAEEAALNLSIALPPKEAIEAINRYLELNPASPPARARLKEIQR